MDPFELIIVKKLILKLQKITFKNVNHKLFFDLIERLLKKFQLICNLTDFSCNNCSNSNAL